VQLWTFLHVVFMFAAVTLAHASWWFVVYATRRRDVAGLRAFERVSGPTEGLGLVFLFLGIVFGVVAALAGGIDLTASWLVAAYVLIGIGVVNGVASVPYSNRLATALRESTTDAATAELSVLMASRQPLVFALVATAVIVLIIAVMVFRPALW
jgi:hypothetical protein